MNRVVDVDGWKVWERINGIKAFQQIVRRINKKLIDGVRNHRIKCSRRGHLADGGVQGFPKARWILGMLCKKTCKVLRLG